MLIRSLYKEVEWYFYHYWEIKEAAREPSLLGEVCGKTICSPEGWVDVMDRTYERHRHLISPAMHERYDKKKDPQVIADLFGVSKKTYFKWRNEFINDALFLAVTYSLISPDWED